MGNGLFEVIKPGLSTTIQDLGRHKFRQYGVVASGAMDTFALQVSNLLVGNNRNTACLEVSIMGPKLKVLTDTVLSICGAHLSPTIDGHPLEMWKSHFVHKGQVLAFGRPVSGAYAYIATSHPIQVPSVMGSKSTYTKAKLGGLEGRVLEKGDILHAEDVQVDFGHIVGRGLSQKHIPNYEEKRHIRVIKGPDDDLFTSESMDKLFHDTFQLTSQADRMGYRLKGPRLKHKGGADIISDAILAGTIQVPQSGNPIVLLADGQTAGGYARIATVIFVDLPLLVQTLPNEQLGFSFVSVEEAQNLFIEQENVLKQLSIATGVHIK